MITTGLRDHETIYLVSLTGCILYRLIPIQMTYNASSGREKGHYRRTIFQPILTLLFPLRRYRLPHLPQLKCFQRLNPYLVIISARLYIFDWSDSTDSDSSLPVTKIPTSPSPTVKMFSEIKSLLSDYLREVVHLQWRIQGGFVGLERTPLFQHCISNTY